MKPLPDIFIVRQKEGGNLESVSLLGPERGRDKTMMETSGSLCLTEPYGFSGKWKRGAASYDQAKIDTKVVGSAVTITLK
jgi:hypothetical protein